MLRKRKLFAFGLFMLCGTVFLLGCGGGNSTSPGGGTTPPGTQVAVTFTGGAPLVVADQIGTGTWAAATVQSGVLNLTIPQGTTTYGIAYLCPTYQGMGPVKPEYVLYATISDPTSYSVPCFAAPTTGTVTGSVKASSIAGTTGVEVVAPRSFGQFLSSSSGSFNFSAPTGTSDIAALAINSTNNVIGVKFARSQTIPGSVSGGINLAVGDATTTQTMTVTPIPSGFNPSPALSAEYATANGTAFNVMNASSSQYSVVSSSDVVSSDYYIFSSNDSSQTQTGQNIGVLEAVSATPAPGPVTLSLPTPLAYLPPSPASLPTFTISYTGFSSANFVSYVGNMQWFTNTSTNNDVTVTATAAYQNGATTLNIPDLSSVSGFLGTPASGTNVFWYAYVYGGSYPWWTLTAPAGGNLAWTQNSGHYTAP